jgi:hypothetical protein
MTIRDAELIEQIRQRILTENKPNEPDADYAWLAHKAMYYEAQHQRCLLAYDETISKLAKAMAVVEAAKDAYDCMKDAWPERPSTRLLGEILRAGGYLGGGE